MDGVNMVSLTFYGGINEIEKFEDLLRVIER